ncbi:hypothetical protein JQC92_10870 [Shewanella sp. 202IG2-18]|uniref:hypothetical protein n=1 Tax=Parashewanella hymeniacidonis TaxID=2807618 RepID=UPI001962168D|nr:hypothetical protein [Parashewanella hymeniacidonis]MBM7072531.1 hypothetical protein [Parashewanella hymeniacidonis]
MKKYLLFWVLICLAPFSQAQDISIESTLESWKYEKLELPLDFAPSITYQGFEELKFAPGMFKPTSTDYFSYIFLFKLDNNSLLSKKELKTLLEAYYKGLFSATSANKKTTATHSDIKVLQIQGYKTNYHATLNFHDCFNHCQQLSIIIELEQKLQNGNLHLMASASAQPQSSEVWDIMRRTWYEIK